jgi:hypothetical protein
VHGLAAKAEVRLSEFTIRPMDAQLIKVTGAEVPSEILVIIAEVGKNKDGRRSNGYCGAKSRGGGKRKKSRPRPHDLRNCPRYLKV